MPETAALERAVARWNTRDRGIDAQLPERGLSAAAEPLIERAGDEIAAAGVPDRVIAEPDGFGALWGALARESFELRWDGDGAALRRLLDRWIDASARGLGEPGDWETALSLSAPSRDSALVQPLLERGFTAVGVVGLRLSRPGAATLLGGHGPAAPEARLLAAGYRLRPAGENDLQLLAELDVELLGHDAQHGTVSVRPGAGELLGRGIAERLRADPEWTWILESDAGPAGYLSLEIDRPWHRAQCAAGGPVAHIQAMYLRETVRGGGVGEAVVQFGHERLARAGFDRILLDYAALNPRSGPFWNRMGYRPLWTHWQRRPARFV